jgi:hypothetical protein
VANLAAAASIAARSNEKSFDCITENCATVARPCRAINSLAVECAAVATSTIADEGVLDLAPDRNCTSITVSISGTVAIIRGGVLDHAMRYIDAINSVFEGVSNAPPGLGRVVWAVNCFDFDCELQKSRQKKHFGMEISGIGDDFPMATCDSHLGESRNRFL